MSASRKAMERMQIIVPRKQKQRMKEMAARANVSISELYRRAADAYSIDDDSDEIEHPELEALVEALEAGNRRAKDSLGRVEREIAVTLDFYDARREARELRRSKSRTG